MDHPQNSNEAIRQILKTFVQNIIQELARSFRQLSALESSEEELGIPSRASKFEKKDDEHRRKMLHHFKVNRKSKRFL